MENDHSSDVYYHKSLLNKLGYVSDDNVNETVDAEYYEGFEKYFSDVEQITTDFYKRCSDLNFFTQGQERNECQRFHHRQRERATARVDAAFCELKRIAEQHVGTAETYDIYKDERCNCNPSYGPIAKECFLER